MKLAEALIERSDLQKQLEIFRKRMVDNAKAQDGLEPNEAVEFLTKELNSILSRLDYLIIHINKTNEYSLMADGSTLSATIAKKDILKKRLSLLGDLLNSGSELISRYSRSEIRIKATFSVPELQKEVDSISKQLRTLDTKLQEANWLTELI